MARPTATQKDSDVHETPAKELDIDHLGVGAERIVQEVPFHVCASGSDLTTYSIISLTLLSSENCPTVMQNLSAGHAAVDSVSAVPVDSGVV